MQFHSKCEKLLAELSLTKLHSCCAEAKKRAIERQEQLRKEEAAREAQERLLREERDREAARAEKLRRKLARQQELAAQQVPPPSLNLVHHFVCQHFASKDNIALTSHQQHQVPGEIEDFSCKLHLQSCGLHAMR